jgi:hypothetical protein
MASLLQPMVEIFDRVSMECCISRNMTLLNALRLHTVPNARWNCTRQNYSEILPRWDSLLEVERNTLDGRGQHILATWLIRQQKNYVEDFIFWRVLF